ncbi:hypothetical protein LRE75_33080 [Streptomyces sp. 372A]
MWHPTTPTTPTSWTKSGTWRPDALAALKNASLPSGMISPIADALILLAPYPYNPAR